MAYRKSTNSYMKHLRVTHSASSCSTARVLYCDAAGTAAAAASDRQAGVCFNDILVASVSESGPVHCFPPRAAPVLNYQRLWPSDFEVVFKFEILQGA